MFSQVHHNQNTFFYYYKDKSCREYYIRLLCKLSRRLQPCLTSLAEDGALTQEMFTNGRLENSRCMFQISRHRQVIYHPPTPQRGLQFVFPHPMLELHVDLRGVEISCCTRRRQWLDLNIGWSSDYLWTKGLKSHFIRTAAPIRQTIKYRFGIAWLHRRTRISVSFAPTIV